MSDETQNRLKAFLERNRNRVAAPATNLNTEPANTYYSTSSTKTDPEKFDTVQNATNNPKFPENANRTLPQSIDDRKSARDFEGVSFEYQPVSLFDVIGNTPYGEGHESTRNNSLMYNEQNKLQRSDIYSIAYTSPGKQTDRNTEYDSKMTDRRNENNMILQEEYNSPANFKKSVAPAKDQKLERSPRTKASGAKEPRKDTQSPPQNTKVQNKVSAKESAPQASPPNVFSGMEKLQPQRKSSDEKVGNIKERAASLSFNESLNKSHNNNPSFEELENASNNQLSSQRVSEVEYRSKSPASDKKKKTKSSPQKSQEDSQQINNSEIGDGSNEIFMESSRKLNNLNETTPNDSEFKKEIRNLIKIIKQEKEQVVGDLRLMAEDLNKYKSAFKKLQKQKGLKSADPTIESPGREGIENSKNSSAEKKGESSQVTENANKAPSVKKNSVDQGNPSKKKNQNTVVETSMNLKDSATDYELSRNPVNEFVIKDMNLNSKLFFKEEKSEGQQNVKPTIADLVSSQREIINFLVKRHQEAEHKRLKTEEQASKVVASMEKAIKQLENKDTLSKTRSSPSPINSKRKTPVADQF